MFLCVHLRSLASQGTVSYSGNRHAGVFIYYKESLAIKMLTINYLQECISQEINQPTHIFQNFNSCIDLVFTNQQNLITDSGIHPSLHSNCHHQIIYGKFNLKIFYPPPYERHIWHYKHANTDMISKAIQGFDWDKAFLDKSTEEKASILTKTILNIMSNFILNEIVTIDDRDAPWILKKTIF